MRKMISFAVFALLATSLSAQNVANMKDLNAEKKSAAINLKLTGTLTTTRNSDFRQLRDLCWQLRTLDLSEATCPVLPRMPFIPVIICRVSSCQTSCRRLVVRLSLPATICRM